MGIIYAQTEDQVFELARVELKAQMDAMMAAMSGDNPKPLAVYNVHTVLKATLPAISIDVMSANLEESARSYGSGGNVIIDNVVLCSIRVHTNWDFEGSYFDSVTCWRLLNSIKNWLTKHRPLGNGFSVSYIGEIKAPEYYGVRESLTIGGSLNIDMKKITELALV